jgi:hypothetical protein
LSAVRCVRAGECARAQALGARLLVVHRRVSRL